MSYQLPVTSCYPFPSVTEPASAGWCHGAMPDFGRRRTWRPSAPHWAMGHGHGRCALRSPARTWIGTSFFAQASGKIWAFTGLCKICPVWKVTHGETMLTPFKRSHGTRPVKTCWVKLQKQARDLANCMSYPVPSILKDMDDIDVVTAVSLHAQKTLHVQCDISFH